MPISFLTGSFDDSITARLDSVESDIGGGGGLPGRVTSLETWRTSQGAALGPAIVADLFDANDVNTTTLPALVGIVNTTNTKVNTLAVRVNAIKDALEQREIVST